MNNPHNSPVNRKIIATAILVIIVAMLFYCYGYLSRVLPSVMVEGLATKFGSSTGVHSGSLLGMLSAYFFWSYTLMQLPAGILLDRFGPRKIMLLATSACTVGAFLFAYTDNLLIAELGRFIIGFGTSFAFIGTLKLSANWLSTRWFAVVSGLTASIGLIGAMISVICLSKLVANIGMDDTAIFSASVGLIIMLLTFIFIREKKSPDYKIAKTPTRTFKSVFEQLLLMLKKPSMWLLGLIGCFLYLPISGFAVLWGVPYFESSLNIAKSQAVLILSWLFLGYAVSGPVMAFISNYSRSRKWPLIIGGATSAALLSVVLYGGIQNIVVLKTLVFTTGLFAGVQPLVFSISHEYNSSSVAATASALTNMFITLGGSIFLPLFGFLLDMHHASTMVGLAHTGTHVTNTLHFVTSDYAFALASLPALLVIASVLSIFIKETRGRHLEA